MSKSLSRNVQALFPKACVMVVAIALLAACGGFAPAQPAATMPAAASAQSTATIPAAAAAEPTQTLDPDETPEPTEPPNQSDAPGTLALEIGTATGAQEFKYDKDTLEAPAGSKIKLKFTNNTNPKDEVGHNWVLVKPGQEESVLANGIKAGDNKDWLDVKDPGILARTRLLEGNQKHTITFDAPPVGTYVFLCTFPEHYAGGMKGTLIVK